MGSGLLLMVHFLLMIQEREARPVTTNSNNSKPSVIGSGHLLMVQLLLMLQEHWKVAASIMLQ